ncbi:alpha/beta hydrolase [Roseivivax sp. THAF30]|uniref:alpha/beta hydrolase n=1 Tax=Roseivivax sp. THAF30 TaxID=2587852 RepID=UPI0012A9A037|nr:alpha/beta hydrolase [Roseivivax sp. THAF30]QFT62312.1 hypothetical protein FIU91_05175 [Roseivivax sp. THAF30]
MPVLPVTALPEGLVPHDADMPLAAQMAEALAGSSGPIIVMVHGFTYAPGRGIHCPHETLFNAYPQRRADGTRRMSWPRRLGCLEAGPDAALGISFGWPARGSIWKAAHEADAAGARLAELVRELRLLAPHRPISAIGHSLGAKVILRALAAAPARSIESALLLAPAATRADLKAARHAPAGQTVRIASVAGRENWVFEALYLTAMAAGGRPALPLVRSDVECGRGVSLRIDDAVSLQRLSAAGYQIGAPRHPICHWSAYTRPGLMRLYRDLLTGRLPFDVLRMILPPHEQRATDAAEPPRVLVPNAL